MVMYAMSDLQFQAVYNVLSFSLASMMATTMYLWLRAHAVKQYQSAVVISGLVTFIAAYHYFRIFNSWVEAYEYPLAAPKSKGVVPVLDPKLTGIPFNDGYRYMDWLVTVPLLLIEIVLVMNLSPKETVMNAIKLGSAAALMVILGYPGEVAFSPEDIQYRWIFWALGMIPFLYIVFILIFKLRAAVASETDAHVRKLIKAAQFGTIISWCTYPLVYILPMCGVGSANAVVAVQVGYTIADVISKCGVGFLIYFVTSAKSEVHSDKSVTGLLGQHDSV